MSAWWQSFRSSRLLPATVIVGILTCAVALFVGAYTYATANPHPERIPISVVGNLPPAQSVVVERELETALDSSLEIRRVGDHASAVELLDEQDVFAIISVSTANHTVALEVSSASGQAVATLLEQEVPGVMRDAGYSTTVADANPLQPGDPHGLTIFYMTIASVVVGFVGAVQLGVHARELKPWERIAFTAAYALLGGFAVAAVVDWLLGALDLPFVESWLIVSLTMFTCGMVFTMFSSLFGRWAMIPTWAIMILLGNPSSGGSVAWPLLPRTLATIGGWLPPGASVNAQHTAVYFNDHQHIWPFLVLAAWSLISVGVYLGRERVRGRPASDSVVVSDGAA